MIRMGNSVNEELQSLVGSSRSLGSCALLYENVTDMENVTKIHRGGIRQNICLTDYDFYLRGDILFTTF